MVSATGKVALVTLIRSSDHDPLSADELAEQIRRNIESSALSETWTVDRVAVLDEGASTAKALSTQKAKKVAIA